MCKKFVSLRRICIFLHNNISYEGFAMVFTSKQCAFLLLMSSASLFSADSNFVSVDGESRKVIQKLQTQCATLNGLLGKWTIESDKNAAVESVRKEVYEGAAQIQWNFGFRNAPILALQDLHRDKRVAHIAYILGVHLHIDKMWNFLSTDRFACKDCEQHVQTIKNYTTAAALIAQQDGIRDSVDLLRSAVKQATSDAVKIIIYERLDIDQVEREHANAEIIGIINTIRMNLNEEKELKGQELQGEQANVQTVQEANIKLANCNSYLKSRNTQLEQEKLKIEKECSVVVANKEAIVDVLRKNNKDLKDENATLKEELGRLLQNNTQKNGWFGGLFSSSSKKQ
jgi:hypothetical protein